MEPHSSSNPLYFQSAHRSGIVAFLHRCDSARVAAQQASWTAIANYLRTIYSNESVNWGQIVFLAAIVVTMAGCGLLSRLVKRNGSPVRKSRSRRLAIRKSSSKASTRTLTSSDDDYEDEDDDNSGSFSHNNNTHHTASAWPSQPCQQSSDG